MPSRHVVLAGRADQYLAGCWQSQESTKLCTRDYDYGHHHYRRHHYYRYHHDHHHRRKRGRVAAHFGGHRPPSTLLLRGQVKERGAKEGYHTFLIAISNTFARRLMRNAEKLEHRGDVPRARRDSERNDGGIIVAQVWARR